MAVIEQDYDIDLKSTGAFPVVKCSQFDTGSREIVFTVYDNWELANIDGCLARVDGTRNDGTEFSVSCTVSTGSKVSFTISQEMTKSAGKHAAELVIFDKSGNPIGTQNFIIDVETAPMVRDAAASADDRTLYDQYTQSIDQKFDDLSVSVTKTVEDISALIGASSEPIVVFSGNVEINNGVTNSIGVRVTYDPVTALVHCWINGEFIAKKAMADPYRLGEIPLQYCPSDDDFDFNGDTYVIAADNLHELVSGDKSPDANRIVYQLLKKANSESAYLQFDINATARVDAAYELSLNATWYARGGKYMGVKPIGTGGNTVTVGTTTTGAPGTQASVVNSGTAKDVVLDFTIPSGGEGTGGAVSVENATILCIGDSFGDRKATDHGAWTTELAALIPNANLVVQCESGTGFWRTFGTNFKTQIANAKAAGVKPDIVVIAGGVNDTNAPLDELQTRVTSTFEEASNDFPNAQIVMIPMMAGYYHLTLQRRKVAHVIMNVAAQMGIPFARYMWWWNAGNRDNVVADNLHPTQKGARLLAYVILAFLQGREILPATKITEVQWNGGTLRRYISGGRVHIHFMGNVTDASTFEKVLALPEIVTSTAQTKIVSGYSDSGTLPLLGYFELNDNVENITFHITSNVGVGQCLFDIEYEV